jgi:hypothetical protein
MPYWLAQLFRHVFFGGGILVLGAVAIAALILLCPLGSKRTDGKKPEPRRGE